MRVYTISCDLVMYEDSVAGEWVRVHDAEAAIREARNSAIDECVALAIDATRGVPTAHASQVYIHINRAVAAMRALRGAGYVDDPILEPPPLPPTTGVPEWKS